MGNNLFHTFCILFIGLFLGSQYVLAQQENNNFSELFTSLDPLPLKFTYSNKKMRKAASAETYLNSNLLFLHNEAWDSIAVRLKARGNFRRKNCYFPPIKLKIKATEAKGTLFEGFKENESSIALYASKTV